jgi:hypothetical protein
VKFWGIISELIISTCSVKFYLLCCIKHVGCFASKVIGYKLDDQGLFLAGAGMFLFVLCSGCQASYPVGARCSFAG